METFFWHDYETFGRSPSWQRASQFAGVRTDFSLNIIEEPVNFYCQPSMDTLPEPEACLITGITPQLCLQQGLSEKVFAENIFRILSVPGTCGAGYNSIRFDDVFTRNLFYRNFLPVYDREWKNNNSRWDLINVLRLARALRPEGICWPDHEDGKPSFRLEDLAKANKLQHDAAHDALSDVLATIALAKLLKTAQPRLFDYAMGLRRKRVVAGYVDPVSMKPFFHVSSRLKPENLYSALMVPLAALPGQSATIICFDLMQDPAVLLDASVEDMRERVFTRQSDMAEGQQRPALKQVATNRIPMVADISVVDEAAAARLNIDKGLCEKHWQQILGRRDTLAEKVVAAMAYEPGNVTRDVDEQLYDGFFPEVDNPMMERVRRASAEALPGLKPDFVDPRLAELFFRFKARNFPEVLDEREKTQWHAHRKTRLLDKVSPEIMTATEYDSRIAELTAALQGEPDKLAILQSLRDWKSQLTSHLS